MGMGNTDIPIDMWKMNVDHQPLNYSGDLESPTPEPRSMEDFSPEENKESRHGNFSLIRNPTCGIGKCHGWHSAPSGNCM